MWTITWKFGVHRQQYNTQLSLSIPLLCTNCSFWAVFKSQSSHMNQYNLGVTRAWVNEVLYSGCVAGDVPGLGGERRYATDGSWATSKIPGSMTVWFGDRQLLCVLFGAPSIDLPVYSCLLNKLWNLYLNLGGFVCQFFLISCFNYSFYAHSVFQCKPPRKFCVVEWYAILKISREYV